MKLYIECGPEDEEILGFSDELDEIYLKSIEITEEEIKKIIGKYARRFCKGFDANIITHDSAKAIINLLKGER